MRAVLVALLVAYVMPSYSILKRLAGGRDELTVTSLRIDGIAAVQPVVAHDLAADLGTQWTSGELSLTAAVSMRLPGRCRLELTSPESTKTLVAVWNNGKKRIEGGTLAAAQVAVDQLCASLALHSATDGESRVLLERHLASLKVDARLTSLARFSGAVAFVIGDRADTAAQFWVYQDHFEPARVRFTDEQGAWDVRFLDYSGQATGEWFPRIVEVYRGQELQLRLTALTADGKASLEGVKF